MTTSTLAELRQAIETIDRQILGLLAQRQTIVKDVAKVKLEAASPLRDPEREEQLLLRLRAFAVERSLDPFAIEQLYRVIMTMSVATQQETIRSLPTAPLRVTYQGVEGSYSHLAASDRYRGRPGGALLTGMPSFVQAAQAVVAGEADFALLPIENTTAGSINETYDLLSSSGLLITGEMVRAVEHCLLAMPGASLSDIRTVWSHPQALAQCSNFLSRHPQLIARAQFDTAGSAQQVAQLADRSCAAIASEAAAQRYGLVVLAHAIQNERANATRFVELSKEMLPSVEGGPNKTSLLFELEERSGGLADVLVRLANHSLTLTKLESRPIPNTPFRYRFYADVIGHAASPALVGALTQIRPITSRLLVLGSYPQAQG